MILFCIIFSVQWYCTGSMGGAVVRTFASHHWLWPEFKALSFNAILRFSPLLKTWHFQIRIPARMVEFGKKLPILLILSLFYFILLCAKLLKFEIYIVVNLQGSARTSEAYDIKKSEGNALLSFTVCCLFSFLVCCLFSFLVCCWCFIVCC